MNCMIVEACSDDVSCLMCDTIEDYNVYQFDNYSKNDQHRLNLISQVKAEDIKVERKYHGNVITLYRLSTTELY